MVWSEPIFLDPDLEKHFRRIKWKIMHNIAQREVFLLILPLKENRSLQLISSMVLLQKNYPMKDFCVVGLAASKAAGFRLIEQITSEMYEKMKKIDYYQFFNIS